MQELSGEIQYVKGVGPERAKVLQKLGITDLYSLIYYFPRMWIDRSTITPMKKLIPGQKAAVKGTVWAKETRQIRPRLKITTVVLRDESGFVSAVWYNQPYMEKVFNKGDSVIMYGKVEAYRGNFQMPVPEYEVIQVSGEDKTETLNVNRIVPIYPLTENLSQKQFRKIIKAGIDSVISLIAEPLPEEVLSAHSLSPIKEALMNIHYPEDFASLERAKRRFIFEDFFFLKLAFEFTRRKIREEKGVVLNKGGCYQKALAALPFKLTGAQERVLSEICEDVSSGRPMNRLLQGDVGSGKTVAAFLACAMAKDSGFQSAIMAPTEILARQHMNTISKLAGPAGIRAELITGAMKKKERAQLLEALKTGEIDILTGTHAIIQEGVEFKSLGLAVIDEQHRFGVMQRAALAGKAGIKPHSLIMTATPIPRTLTLTVYGDTDLSVIDEMPPGRKSIKTMLFSRYEKNKIMGFLSARITEGAQIYAVYPLVDESEKIPLKSAVQMEKEWSQRFPAVKTALIHGQMKKDEKEAVMAGFKSGEVKILVATTVIEVGIDVPNATVMVVEHAERFGLSQLHQLRGRVGRGAAQSYCILIGDPNTEEGFKRLNVMVSTTDGFKISEEDLAIRGPGEFLGTRQHGLPEFKIADILRDRGALEEAGAAAETFVNKSDINHLQKKALFSIMKQKYGNNINLADVG